MTHQILSKLIRRFGKFYLRMASVDPRRMAGLPGCSDAVMFYWSQIVEAANNLPAIKGTVAYSFLLKLYLHNSRCTLGLISCSIYGSRTCFLQGFGWPMDDTSTRWIGEQKWFAIKIYRYFYN